MLVRVNAQDGDCRISAQGDSRALGQEAFLLAVWCALRVLDY